MAPGPGSFLFDNLPLATSCLAGVIKTLVLMASYDSGEDGQDRSIASLAVGFTLGFGFLTVWEAIKQTRRSKNPRRSVYVYMIWGQILANVGILVLGNLVFYGVIDSR